MLSNTHDRYHTVSNIFRPYLKDLLLNFKIFAKDALTRSIFELEKCSFFNGSVIDWCHYQGASQAPMCIVRHQTLTKTPTR